MLLVTCSTLALNAYQRPPPARPRAAAVRASVTAVAISVVLALSDGSQKALAVLSAVVAAAACGACFRMHRLYSASMWSQILKRELATGAPVVYRLNADSTVASKVDLAG